ncbi:hypothetical protein N2601_08665 [Rhizobium sp. CB3060]|uniref:hypothetical protein n=1 Tax=Rhizobium sp. CB3060 TaxID=3138255 RepID=UPI0021A772A6|nr:hypothetical protein [Rhizobium tropici]UWU23001.1 hypothetical protein N2601_08665 [Rhizobium tropici]
MTLDELKSKYARLLRSAWFEHRDGWADILDAYFAVIDHILPPNGTYEVRQIKEKMGTLRIYDSVSGAASEIGKVIEDARELAEARSLYTCEHCGQPGILRNPSGLLHDNMRRACALRRPDGGAARSACRSLYRRERGQKLAPI